MTESSDKELESILELLKRICETPAPTFAEEKRADLVAGLWREAGSRPEHDEVGNVIATIPGGEGLRVLLAAHLDTVFPAETDVCIRADGDLLRAPGIGDNSTSLALLTRLVQAAPEPRPRLTVAATVGEEGLGNLRGIRKLMQERASDFDAVIALDGHLGTIVNASVGSKRFEVAFRASGGHSWGDYPSPSANHALGEAIYSLGRLNVPSYPRSSFNVGQVWGGTSVNAIAEEAGFNLDLRSLEAEVLDRLEADALARINRVAKQHKVSAEVSKVGDRPAASVDNEALVEIAQAALRHIGVTGHTAASSTDANAAMAVGLPAIAFGIYRGGDAHRLSEWIDVRSLVPGFDALKTLLAGLSRESLTLG